jgi:putative membrane protein
MDIRSTALLADFWDTNGHMGGGWWIVMMIWMGIFWVAIVAGVVWLVRGGASTGWRAERRESPLEILDRRFAEGAISADEYRERREVIAGGGQNTRSS